ncbi:hypothetical protein TVAG_217070 [Trichomonas vaginalis G3]|uniref:Anaphase-promoting complex subunit 4 WD40 domain-containing protein n=1 Tax=Trichomonas vaginalis (strain ATCC PRA-98 / G3) TaxID=412133 RepID=A2F542_TRIV3|nr:phosphatidylinositol-3,5-bisphosphate binding [Trichomonas vaginalis G3]EAX99985.1 hypothetical protein TVAG_217070 [Trichomonas vaginalis G3]KAI5519797.1 phosphatidylinositol-3,5-bisphosphate binding [Trichomonas vaginalis G3]|eukprot:XP_001312915.1 hypothetical protein [Trichomonas vaginalis G3]
MKANSVIRNVSFDDFANIIGLATCSGFTVIYSSSGEFLTDVRTKDDRLCPYGCNLISTFGMSNIIALTYLDYNTTDVFIWDRFKAKLLTTCHFEAPITGIKLRPDIIIASSQKCIYVMNLSDFKIVAQFETAFNRDGIFDLTPSHIINMIVFPAAETGVIGIIDIYDKSVPPRYIHCFKTSILGIKVSQNGRLIAIAGDEGRQINIYNYPSLQIVARLKRGNCSKINSISFDEHRNRLALIDNTETFLVFDLHQQTEDDAIRPTMKLKYSDNPPMWINFNAKVSGIVGVTSNGGLFKVATNSDEKSAICEPIISRLKIK